MFRQRHKKYCRNMMIFINWGNHFLHFLNSWAISRPLGTLCPLHAHQAPASHEQVRQCTSEEQAVRVLLHSTISDLGKSKHAFDDTEGMFNLGTHA